MEISGSFSDYLSLMLGKPRIRLNNLKTSLKFPCIGLNPIIDSINLLNVYSFCFQYYFFLVANFFFARLFVLELETLRLPEIYQYSRTSMARTPLGP